MSAIASDNPFTDGEAETLSALVGMMIPASEKYAIPGADDVLILADILGTARAHAEGVKAGLAALDAHGQDIHGGAFPTLDLDVRMAIVDEFKQSSAPFIRAVTSITVQCYYRDARVMESLGMEARPPFPKGYELEQGEWSLLDPVRDRGKMWRDAT